MSALLTGGPSAMNSHRILVVDDEPTIRDSMFMLLASVGYEVTTATDGLDALLQLKTKTCELIISDLNMPKMSGFEFLSVVRRRFPEIAVIAISGAYESGKDVPGGVIADAFYPKGRHAPQELFRIIAELIATPLPARIIVAANPRRSGYRGMART
jgi:CheY-like chemotaxis protein